jgi:hypothetical protein
VIGHGFEASLCFLSDCSSYTDCTEFASQDFRGIAKSN